MHSVAALAMQRDNCAEETNSKKTKVNENLWRTVVTDDDAGGYTVRMSNNSYEAWHLRTSLLCTKYIAYIHNLNSHKHTLLCIYHQIMIHIYMNVCVYVYMFVSWYAFAYHISQQRNHWIIIFSVLNQHFVWDYLPWIKYAAAVGSLRSDKYIDYQKNLSAKFNQLDHWDSGSMSRYIVKMNCFLRQLEAFFLRIDIESRV